MRFIDAVLDETQDALECLDTLIPQDSLDDARGYGPLSEALSSAFVDVMRAHLEAGFSLAYLVPTSTAAKMLRAKTRGQTIISPPSMHGSKFWVPEVCCNYGISVVSAASVLRFGQKNLFESKFVVFPFYVATGVSQEWHIVILQLSTHQVAVLSPEHGVVTKPGHIRKHNSLFEVCIGPSLYLRWHLTIPSSCTARSKGHAL